jgi:hypothetical protein
VEQEGDTMLIFGEYFEKRENRAKAQDKSRQNVASLERQHKTFLQLRRIFHEAWISSSEKYAKFCDIEKIFFTKHEKKGRRFFAEGSKNGMYAQFHAS